jgi:glycosyltransferase involved in cell wall biosynthesis
VKVLLDCPVPFSLAHGGAQIQIEQTRAALATIGVEVDYLRWWDDTQRADVIHHFGRLAPALIKLAQQKGTRVVISELLTAQGSRGPAEFAVRQTAMNVLDALSGGRLGSRLGWDSYRQADACVALTPWEAQLMRRMFHAPAERVHVVPNGVEEIFFQAPLATRGPWLVCTATITERKRVVELTSAAIAARTPLWIIGKPYAETDPYYRRFLDLVRQAPETIRFDGPISDRAALARIYREARGFVLLSTMESLSLSALEAAACECPLLLSDLPWARTTFADSASYCPATASMGATAGAVRAFHDAAPRLPPPPKPLTWIDVARQLRTIYEAICA